MSDLHRLERLAKSLIPRFPQGGERYYTHSDARLAINGLGLNLQPETLAYLVEHDVILEDFVNSLYHLEHRTGKSVLTEFAEIDPDYTPAVYEESGKVVFTVVVRGKEIVFAEYQIS
ncbi:MAG: hypothetical protein SF053_03625 [Bacteroidia bacterium]|nr:hypothetical protein [Bacteroidia bacterium]